MKDWIRAMLRGNWRPIAVPHHRLLDADDAAMENILSLCDGTRTLAEVPRITGVSKLDLVRMARDGLLMLWPDPPAPPPAGDPKIIIVSPHLDDAALSLGGQMLQWKSECLVLDIFSTVSWWRLPYDSPDDPRIQAARAAEEDLMAKLVGCQVRKLGFLEAPRRGYTLENIFSAEISASDADVAKSICDHLSELLRGDYQWFLPLAAGNHVDHRLARDTVLSALLDANISKERIRFYEDLFYAAQLPGIPDFSAAIPGRLLRVAEQVRVDARMKSRLLQVYGSQLVWSQIKMVQRYARRFGSQAVERTWAIV